MIYKAVKEALEELTELQPAQENGEEQGRVYPTGVCIDDIELPVAVYTRGKCESVTDLSGAVHHYVETITVDLLAATYDEAQDLAWEAEQACRALAQTGTPDGAYIFSVAVTVPETDAADLSLEVLRRTLAIEVRWCPMDAPFDDVGEETELSE